MNEKDIDYNYPLSIQFDYDVILNQDNSMSESFKEIALIISQDNDILLFNEKARDAIADIDFNSVGFNSIRSSIKDLEYLKILGEIHLESVDKLFSNLWSNSNFYSFQKYLRKYNTKKLFIIYFNEVDEEKKKFIWDYIVYKEKTRKYSSILRKIDKKKNKLISCLIKTYKRNLRFFLRKMQAFLFKNLDDFHENIIIKNMLFVVESQLPVLTFNNYISEKKYFKTN